MNGKSILSTKVFARLACLLMVCFLVACNQQSKQENITKEKTLVVEPQTLTSSLYFSGTINPVSDENVTSPIDGVINNQFFKYGQEIRKDQSLFSITSDRLEKEYIEAFSTYIKAQDDFSSKQRKFSGSEELRKLQFISDNEYYADKTSKEESNFALQQAIRHLKEVLAKIGIRKNLNEIDINNPTVIQGIIQSKLDNFIVKATAHGIALHPQKNSEEGTAENKAGLGSEIKQGQVLLALGNMTGISVTIDVNEIDVNQLKVDQKATITGAAFPEITLQGYIKYITAQAKSDNSSSLPVFPVTIVVPKITSNEQKVIRVGMSAKVEIRIEEPEVLTIPLVAVFQENGRSKVKIKDNKTKLVTAVNVVTGKTTLDSIVIEHGLKKGDIVVYDN